MTQFLTDHCSRGLKGIHCFTLIQDVIQAISGTSSHCHLCTHPRHHQGYFSMIVTLSSLLSSMTSKKLFQYHRHIVVFALIHDVKKAVLVSSSHCRLCSHPRRHPQAISVSSSHCRLCSHT